MPENVSRRTAPAARDLRRRDHAVARRGGQQRRDPPGREDRGRRPELRVPVPVRQPGEPARALRGHRSRDLARLPRGRRVRRRPRHERHAHGRRPVPEGAEARGAGRRGRAAGGRARAGPAQPRRRVRARRSSTPDVLDRKLIVRPRESIEWTRRLLDECGVFAGISSGAAVAGAAKMRGDDGRRARSSRCCPTEGGSTSRPVRGPTTSTSSRNARSASTTGERRRELERAVAAPARRRARRVPDRDGLRARRRRRRTATRCAASSR